MMLGESELVTGVSDHDLYVREVAIRYSVEHHKDNCDTATDDALIRTAGRIEAYLRGGTVSDVDA